jgi:putative transposase
LDELLVGKSPEGIAVPRDRNGSFEPQILPNHERRFTGFDDKIISMNARGMSTRDIQAHLQEIYGVEASPGLVSEVTEAVMEDIRAWQSRPGCSGRRSEQS